MVRVRASLSQLPARVPGRKPARAVVPAGNETAATRRRTAAERERVLGRLRAPGHGVPGSRSHLVRQPLGGRSGDFASHDADGQVMVRPFPGEGVRVTSGLPAENDALPALAASWRG